MDPLGIGPDALLDGATADLGPLLDRLEQVGEKGGHPAGAWPVHIDRDE
jgi:hypothetical protein